MHEISVELDVVQAQLGQLAIAGGAILAPVAKEVLPPILECLSSTAKYIAENKENLLSLTKTLVAFTVVYKTLQALQKQDQQWDRLRRLELETFQKMR